MMDSTVLRIRTYAWRSNAIRVVLIDFVIRFISTFLTYLFRNALRMLSFAHLLAYLYDTNKK